MKPVREKILDLTGNLLISDPVFRSFDEMVELLTLLPNPGRPATFKHGSLRAVNGDSGLVAERFHFFSGFRAVLGPW